MSDIYISKPYIKKNGEDLYRLCADVRLDDVTETLFLEVEEDYKDFLVYERADAFVFLTLPIGIRAGYNIISEAPITEMFLHNLNTILIPALVNEDNRAKPIQIIAPTASEDIGLVKGIGTAVTCGVDSTYTIMEYTSDDWAYKNMKLTHLLVSSVSKDLWDYDKSDDLHSWEEKHKEKFDSYNTISEYTGLPLVKSFTNFARYAIRKRPQVGEGYRHVFVHTFITMSSILALRKLFSVYLFASGYDLGEFSLKENITSDTAHYDLLLMHILSTPEFMCFSSGGSVDRIDKTYRLASYPLAQKILHPCFEEGKKNCSSPTCSKCLRGLLSLDYFDKLDDMSEVFNVKRYKNNRIKYLSSLIKRKDQAMFSTLYDMFMEKYPEDMEKANEKVQPVSRNKYNTLLSAYNTALVFLNEDMPKEAVVNFFESKKVKKLFYTGTSKLGDRIIPALREKIVVEDSLDKAEECDAVFICSTSDTQIRAIRDDLALNGIRGKEKKIYTLTDIKKALTKKNKPTA